VVPGRLVATGGSRASSRRPLTAPTVPLFSARLHTFGEGIDLVLGLDI
jgi:hypothetical protein